jgi:DNA-binding Lrp family transcriptional regulator
MRLFWGGIPIKEELEESEKNVLKNIAEDSRTSVVDLAIKLKTTPKKIITRIKKLEEKRIILGYRVNLDLKKIKKGYLELYLISILLLVANLFISYLMGLNLT